MRRDRKLLTAAMILAIALTGTLTACNTKKVEAEAEAQAESQAEVEAEAQTEAMESTEKELEDTKEESTAESEKGLSAKGGVFGTFTAVTLDGEVVDQDIFTKADLTMVNIWGTFCSPCIGELPALGELNRSYRDKGFQVVGIISNVEEPNDQEALEIVDKTKADYTQLVLSEDLYNNYLALVSMVPITVFVDREGRQVGASYAGSKSKSRWKGIIDDKLKTVQKQGETKH